MSVNVDDFRALTYEAKPSVKVYDSGTQALTNSAAAVVTFDTEVFDRWGMHSTASLTHRLTVQVPGIYYVTGAVVFAANATGQRQLQIRHINAAAVARTSIADTFQDATAAGTTRMEVSGLSLVADIGDWFDLVAFQDSGGALNLSAATASTQNNQTLSAIWIARG